VIGRLDPQGWRTTQLPYTGRRADYPVRLQRRSTGGFVGAWRRGSAPALGAGGPRFDPGRPDQDDSRWNLGVLGLGLDHSPNRTPRAGRPCWLRMVTAAWGAPQQLASEQSNGDRGQHHPDADAGAPPSLFTATNRSSHLARGRGRRGGETIAPVCREMDWDSGKKQRTQMAMARHGRRPDLRGCHCPQPPSVVSTR
jgi:hypothetical protein